VCLGAEARAQNKAARRQYKYENDRRERNWMQALSVYGTKKVQYETNVDAADMAIAQAYADEQEQKRAARGKAELQYDSMYRDLLQNSEYSKLIGSGGTGRSAARIGRMETGDYGRKVAEIGRSIIQDDMKLERQTAQTVGQAQAYKQQQFAQVAFQPTPDLKPPVPVMRSVGAAAFMDALSIGSSIATMAMPFVG
jgi:hypothetical protein